MQTYTHKHARAVCGHLQGRVQPREIEKAREETVCVDELCECGHI